MIRCVALLAATSAEARALFRQLLSAARALPSKKAAAKASVNIRTAFRLRADSGGCPDSTAEWLEDGRAALRVLNWLSSVKEVRLQPKAVQSV